MNTNVLCIVYYVDYLHVIMSRVVSNSILSVTLVDCSHRISYDTIAYLIALYLCSVLYSIDSYVDLYYLYYKHLSTVEVYIWFVYNLNSYRCIYINCLCGSMAKASDTQAVGHACGSTLVRTIN